MFSLFIIILYILDLKFNDNVDFNSDIIIVVSHCLISTIRINCSCRVRQHVSSKLKREFCTGYLSSL